MVDEKLPKEIAAKKLELQTYEDVINERNINNQYLTNLQNQVRLVWSRHLVFNPLSLWRLKFFSDW